MMIRGFVIKAVLLGSFFADGFCSDALSLDLTKAILLRWGEAPKTNQRDWQLDVDRVPLLRQGGISVVLLPWPSNATASNRAQRTALRRFAFASRNQSIIPMALLAPEKGSSIVDLHERVASAEQAGLDEFLLDNSNGFLASERSLRDFINDPIWKTESDSKGRLKMVSVRLPEIHWNTAPAATVLSVDLPPGIRSRRDQLSGAERNIEVAGASRDPWIDSNLYLYAYLKGMYPHRISLIGYEPESSASSAQGVARHERLELALSEAMLSGGNCLLSVEASFLQALMEGQDRAFRAWSSLGGVARFFRNSTLITDPNRSRLAIAAGSLQDSREIINLLYRRHGCPRVYPINDLPELKPSQYRSLVVANLPRPAGKNLQSIFNYVRQGGLLICSASPESQPSERNWWETTEASLARREEDRDVFSLGRGRLIAYHKPVSDPSEFALDVVDAIGINSRGLRLWNASSMIAVAFGRFDTGRAFLNIVNYGSPSDDYILTRIEGLFRKVTLVTPTHPTPVELKPARRKDSTEVPLEKIGRLAVIVFEQ